MQAEDAKRQLLPRQEGCAASDMPNTSPAYLTVEEVARRFGVNVTTVYRLVKRGKIPAFKIGNQWRFNPARLEEWVADKERIG